MTSPLIRFSCLVDVGDLFVEQAVRWARSLIEIVGVPAEDIAVHYTRRLDPGCVERLSLLGVRTVPVDALSRDRPHLNKIAQLRSAFLIEADLAVLCDCDTVFVADPRPYFKPGAIAAALVDLPNPSIATWDELLKRAGLERQRPDISVGPGQPETLFENRNGGLYVLPGRDMTRVDLTWRKWVRWLKDHSGLLGRFTFNSDQISFALACIELGIEPDILPKALNFPTHLPVEVDAAPIMLHYHRKVDGAGRLRPIGQQTADRAIAFANERLARPARVHRKRRLLLHVGLPKTGTSALQSWCNAHAGEFLRQGIRYPTPSANTEMPKHQFVVSDLIAGDLARTAEAFAEGDEDSLVLSTEGLTNHLYDFRPSGLERFRQMLTGFDVTVFMVHRVPGHWIKSYHKQCAINPRSAAYNYGSGLELAEFRRLPRIRKMMNIANLTQDCAAAFGAREMVAMPFESDWLARFFELCGFRPETKVELERTNESIDDWIFEAVLRINREGFSDDARIAWLGSLQRFTTSRHVGLCKYEAIANARGLWRDMDPSRACGIAAADDARWSGYQELVQALRDRR